MLHYWKRNSPVETKKYADVIQVLLKELAVYPKTLEDTRPL